MAHIRSIIRKGYITLAIAVMAVMPLGTLSNVSADEACNAPDDSSYGTGVHHPVGAEAPAFTFQCGDDNPYAGLWTSERYVYYPQTNRTQPKEPIVYYYNDDTGRYDFSKWYYTPANNSYHLVSDSVATSPDPAHTIGSPPPVTPPADDDGGSDGSSARSAGVSGSGPGSSNGINQNTNNNGNVTNNTGVTVNNTLNSTAVSGNAMVIGNTNAGSAASGDAVTQADVTNLLQSSSNALGDGNDVATFTYTIDGDVTGDLFFDPDMINDVQGDTTINKNLNNNLTINNTSEATINNDLTLSSQSGDAGVANNTNAGNATSGNAKTVANITNLIRSAITSGKSFVGTINITGNLNGDILLPVNFVDTLIAANTPTIAVTGPGSTSTINRTVNDNTTITNNNTQNIKNTVTSSAQSGTANVSGNTNAGSATTGTAKTSVTAFNLTGSRVVAKNSILVYVNVLGKWTGLIVNAPAGATAAQLGGNVTENTTINNNTTVDNNVNQRINNNVNVRAGSGNASVTGNTNAGNATTGNAETAVNLSNIEDSTFQISDWFGILYINVFGTWNGSFGMDTAAGGMGGKGADETFLVGNVGKLVHYAPVSTKVAATTTGGSGAASTGDDSSIDSGSVLAAETKAAPAAPKLAPPKHNATANLWLPAIGVIISLAILGSERFLNTRRQVS